MFGMSIVTKKGDGGKTSLFLGGVVAKDDPRVEFDGILDELCSFLGVAKSLIKDKSLKRCIESLQKDLFIIGAEAATITSRLPHLSRRMECVDYRRLEVLIDGLERRRKPSERCFVLPGHNLSSSVLDVCRTLTRRAERRAVTLTKKNILVNPHILIYLNRMSDLLYLAARRCEKK